MPVDTLNDLGVIKAIDEQVINTDTTTAGTVVDTETFRGDISVLISGKFTAGDLTPLLEEDDVVGFGTATAVPDTKIKPLIVGGVVYETGQEAAAIIDGTPAIQRLGLKKDQLKRFVRLSYVSANSANVVASGFFIQEALLKSSQGTTTDSLP